MVMAKAPQEQKLERRDVWMPNQHFL